jgi:hypothetical protein
MVKIVAARLLEWPACCPRHEKLKYRIFLVMALSLGITCIAFA